MSAAAVLLASLRSSGAVLAVDDRELVIETEEALTEGQLANLRGHKIELIGLLTREAANTPRYRREVDIDALHDWLCSESLALVLRDGVLFFTDPKDRCAAEPSAALRSFVSNNYAGIQEKLLKN